MQCTTSLPQGNGHCNSCNILPRCLGAIGSAHPAMHCLTAGGRWAMQLLHGTASLPAGSRQWNSCDYCLTAGGGGRVVARLQYVASPPGGNGQWNSWSTLPHCSGAMGSRTLATHPHCRKAVGSGTIVTHCRTAWGQWAVGRVQYTASLAGGNERCKLCNALPHYVRSGGRATRAMHCLNARGQ